MLQFPINEAFDPASKIKHHEYYRDYHHMSGDHEASMQHSRAAHAAGDLLKTFSSKEDMKLALGKYRDLASTANKMTKQVEDKRVAGYGKTAEIIPVSNFALNRKTKAANLQTESLLDNTEDQQVKLVEALTIAQRQKRGMIMRRYKQKIERAREIAKRKLADNETIKKRSYNLARSILRKRLAGERGAHYSELSDGEKIAIDKMLDTRKKAIKVLGNRLIPKVKQAEAIRLQSFLKGKSLQNHGAPEGNHAFNKAMNENFSERFGDTKNKQTILGRGMSKDARARDIEQSDIEYIEQRQFREKWKSENPGKKWPGYREAGFKSRYYTHESFNQTEINEQDEDKAGSKDVKNKIVILKRFSDEKNDNSKIARKLEEKAEAAGIPLDVLGEVYDRGLDSWGESSSKLSREQYAFGRVNSFLNGGTALEEDADLVEKCWKGYKQLGMKEKNGKKVPNCIPEDVYSADKIPVIVPPELKQDGTYTKAITVMRRRKKKIVKDPTQYV